SDADLGAWTPDAGNLATSPDEKGQVSTAITPFLDRAYARLKAIPKPPTARPMSDAALEQLPDQMQLRRMLRKGDISVLKNYLPKVFSQYERGEASERYLYDGLRCLYAVLPEVLPA